LGKSFSLVKIDLVVFTTGVGVSALLEILSTLGSLDRTLEALSKIPLIARGRSRSTFFHEKGLPHARGVDEPATWRDVLKAVDRQGLFKAKL